MLVYLHGLSIRSQPDVQGALCYGSGGAAERVRVAAGEGLEGGHAGQPAEVTALVGDGGRSAT